MFKLASKSIQRKLTAF